MPDPIRQDEWLDELRRLSEDAPADDGFLTTQEIAARMDKTPEAVRKMLQAAAQMGQLILGRKRVAKLDGMTAKSAYKIKSAGADKPTDKPTAKSKAKR